jgi:glycosyltransferase involved in cell wall biosynthesis
MTRAMPGGGDVRVSVSITTYNHAPYIAQAVESVLAQQTTFPFEVIVGDDCSTDDTRDVLRELQAREPHRLRLLLPEHNLGGGGKRMFAHTLDAARGEYIAAFDGDDYWTSPHKLQRQVDFLDAHPACSMCFHNATEVVEGEWRGARLQNDPPPPTFTGMPDVLQRCYIAACTPLFRREVIVPLPAWYFDVPMGDWPLYVMAAERGSIGYIDEVMGARRVHAGGMWSGMDRVRQFEWLLEFYVHVNRATGGRYDRLARRFAAKWHAKLALELSRRGERAAARREAWRALRDCPIGGDLERWPLLVGLAHPYLARMAAPLTRRLRRHD